MGHPYQYVTRFAKEVFQTPLFPTNNSCPLEEEKKETTIVGFHLLYSYGLSGL